MAYTDRRIFIRAHGGGARAWIALPKMMVVGSNMPFSVPGAE
ncbi:hypothetical protein [Shinella kummerowiae]|nr:hypothetical protein [Shinella kummerowiae]